MDIYTVLPTYGEIEEIINADNNMNPLKQYYEKYGLDENFQKEIDNLLNNDTDDI